MSETLDLPAIDEALMDQKPAATAVSTVETKTSLKQVVLDSFAAVHKHCAALAERYRGVVFDHSTPKGRAAAKAARLELREQGRYAVQRLEDRLTEEANDLKRTIKAEAAAAIALTKPAEDDIDAGIKAWEKAEAERKAAEAQKEAARVQRHRDQIARIRAYLTLAQTPGMTSERIQTGIDMLRTASFGPEWEEFAVEAANAQCETLEAMRVLHDEVLAREQAAQRAAEEALRIEAQRLENERIAAEQRAEAERLAAYKRELEREAQALARQQEIEAARQRAEAPAAPVATAAATEGKADNPEPGTLEAAPAQERAMRMALSTGGAMVIGDRVLGPNDYLAPITQDAQESGCSPADAPACASSGADTAQAPLCGDEGPARADHSAPVSDLGAIEAELNDGPAYEVDHDPAEMERISGVRVILADPEQGDEGGPAVPAGPPTLKLGTISERLGFTLTEGFLETLGFPPAARERAARLYHESDWPTICDELVAHVLRCKSGEGA